MPEVIHEVLVKDHKQKWDWNVDGEEADSGEMGSFVFDIGEITTINGVSS